MDEIFEQLLHLAEHTETLIAVYDSHDLLQYANSAFRSVYFIEPDETPLWPDLMRRISSSREAPSSGRAVSTNGCGRRSHAAARSAIALSRRTSTMAGGSG
ncbi:hypothetical protein FHS25_006728 [Rhizobium laguerreae]|uniref:PAS domain-containing protein n=1 Tax=Rhizobium laguerreae TaxID=1076926 RepID=A0ABR6GIS6_9HYPH|nr:hypothetical protein [Rhizobium laguerreae]